MIQETSETFQNIKREKIFDMITKLACKMPEGSIEVPEGLEGFGTIEHKLTTCIGCQKCKDVACEWDAINRNTVLPLNDYLAYENVDDLSINRKILIERLSNVLNISGKELSTPISVPENLFFLGGMNVSPAKCVNCKKCVDICPTESMSSHPYFNLADALDSSKIKPYPYNPTEQDLKNFQPDILTFFCHWCTYGGADLAGTSRMQYPSNTRVIRTTCTGRVDIEFILEALVLGADGVIVSGCLP
ncbi:MAG: hydrogenase iron-sulfur subunit, partial [Candidatus Hermodarchaeota archaeon]